MSSSHRPALQAVALTVALFIIAGCATQTPVVVPPTRAQAAVVTPVSTPALAPPTDVPAPASTLPAPPTVPPASASSGPVEPHFGPAWGDRSIYASGLVSSERKVLGAELAGASEYRVDLKIDDSMTRVAGEQQVHYTNREDVALDDIYVRLFPNALGGKMRVSDVLVDDTGVTPEYQFEDSAVRVQLPQPLQPGKSTVLSLKYDIEVPDTLDNGYGLLSYTRGILALDTPYAPIPVYNDEGWNVESPPENADTSFNDASFYLVRVTAPGQLKLVTTGVEVAREAAGDNQVVTFEQGPARDFFVAASADYVKESRQVGETLLNAYALPGEKAAQRIALDTAEKALGIFSKRFGPYPYTEFDVAASPMLALGIEYPGTVGVSETIYEPGYKPKAGSAETILESTVAHEVAHQWFYNLVGSDQIDEPWLDEALAQYSTSVYFLDRYGEAAATALRGSWEARWDLTEREEKPVGLPARDYNGREYGSIVYGRGPMFVAALADRMGQAKIDQFLKDYSARFRWGIATTADFKALAGKACGCDLTDLYREWLDP
jgi:aminopeptidase N